MTKFNENVHYVGKECDICDQKIRYIKTNKCVRCQSEYAKKYRESNRDRILEVQKIWREENPDYGRIWYEDNKDRRLKQMKQYRLENYQKTLETSRRYYKNNAKKVCKRTSQYKKDNPDKRRTWDNNRRAREQQSEGSYTTEEWLELCDFHGNKCLCCGKTDVKLTVDHVVPLKKGGSNLITNIQPLCLPCNLSKYIKTTDYRQSFIDS